MCSNTNVCLQGCNPNLELQGPCAGPGVRAQSCIGQSASARCIVTSTGAGAPTGTPETALLAVVSDQDCWQKAALVPAELGQCKGRSERGAVGGWNWAWEWTGG